MADPGQSDAQRLFRTCEKCGTPNPPSPSLTHCLGCGLLLPAVGAKPGPARGAGRTRAPIRAARGRLLLAATWLYAAVVLAALVLIRWVGDGWWPITLLLFMPRWAFLLPVAALALGSAVRRRPSQWAVQAAIALVVAGPLMGVSLPVRQLWERPPAGDRVRLVSYNLGQDPLKLGALKRWVEREKVDVFCFQEGVKLAPAFRECLGEGWRLSRRRMIATRLPIVAELPPHVLMWDEDGRWTSSLERVRLRAPSGREFVVASVHLPTLRPGFERFLRLGETAGIGFHQQWWVHETARALTEIAEASDAPVLVGGDFNMPADDSTLAAVRANYRFAFEEAGWGYGYTKPTNRPWIRIDHILAGPEWVVTSCRVGPDFGSDHLPLIADVVLPTAPWKSP